MDVMRRLVWSEMSGDERRALCRRGLTEIFDPKLRESIGALIEDVRQRGDEAVCDALARFDGIALTPDELRVGEDELAAASVSADLDQAIDDAINHVRRFNERQLTALVDWEFESEPGLVVGEKLTPISSVGLFVPSGKASYPSVAYQLGVPATMAGVPRIVLVVPPVPGCDGGAGRTSERQRAGRRWGSGAQPPTGDGGAGRTSERQRAGRRWGSGAQPPTGDGEVDPAVLVVCRKLGITDVCRVNGPAGIAALGFGTERIPRVRKVVGPGSPAVTLTQIEMQRHGVATMMLLGPTESLVIADETADPLRLAADLLIEAEHGKDSSVVLVTTDDSLRKAVDGELTARLADLPAVRADAARASLGVNGGCVLAADLDEAVAIANEYAPEHLQVAVDEAVQLGVVERLVNAGEILVGQHTPFSAANFIIGCPASLPTSGFAHVSSGITAATFLKRTAVASADARAIERMAPSVIALAEHEGFPAHAAAMRHRQLPDSVSRQTREVGVCRDTER